MKDSYQEKEARVEQINDKDILTVQCEVFSADTNYLNAEKSAINTLALKEKAPVAGRELSAEERSFILQAPVVEYIAERAPIFRFFAEHLSDPEAIMHFKKAAETHDQTEVAIILSLFEEFRVTIESSIAKTDPDAWNSLVHAIKEINIHPELQEEINHIFEEYLNNSITENKEIEKDHQRVAFS